MSHIHLDLWLRDAGSFRIKLVDFGANRVFGGGDNSEHEVALTANSTPGLKAGAWTSIDLPLSTFTNLSSRSHLAQIIIAGSSPITYLDNLYFYLAGPTPPAPTPTVGRCNRCWWVCSTFCPTGPSRPTPDGSPRIDYAHCKGCLVCVVQCPPHAIAAVAEHEAAAAGGESP